MTWLIVAALAAACLAALVVGARVPRGGREAIVPALLVGLAGYAAQGHPDYAGAPRPADETRVANTDTSIAARQAMAGNDDQHDRWLMVADALARHGEYAQAANMLTGAVDRQPGNAQAWLALANALVGHAQGTLPPAALLAYARAAAADPAAPGPPYFLGLAQLRSGQLAQGRAQWAGLLARTPASAPWRGDLAQKLARLDMFIAQARRMGLVP